MNHSMDLVQDLVNVASRRNAEGRFTNFRGRMRSIASKWFSAVIGSADPVKVSDFWAEALDYQVVFSSPDEVAMTKDEHSWPGLVFVPVPEGKQVKNRLHIDLNPDDQAAEFDRFIALGATRVDIGQGEVRWVVLADPEGNEFCVLSPHPEQE